MIGEVRMTQNTNVTMDEKGPVVADGKRAVVTVERMKVKKRSNFETLIKFGTDASKLIPLLSRSSTALRALDTYSLLRFSNPTSTANDNPT